MEETNNTEGTEACGVGVAEGAAEIGINAESEIKMLKMAFNGLETFVMEDKKATLESLTQLGTMVGFMLDALSQNGFLEQVDTPEGNKQWRIKPVAGSEGSKIINP